MRLRGHDVAIMAVRKDISIELLNSYDLQFHQIGTKRNGLIRTALEQWAQTVRAVVFLRKFKPDVVVGRPSQSINVSAFILRIPRIIFAEDDLAVAPLAGITAYPYATVV